MDRAQACLRAQGPSRNALPGFVRAICPPSAPTALSEGDGDGDFLDDPVKMEYLRQLIDAIFESRAIVASYNAFVLLAIAVLALLHWRETRRDWRKWRRLREGWRHEPAGKGSRTASPATTASKSSAAAGDIDVERVPLLAGSGSHEIAARRRRMGAIVRAVSSWLARQPAFSLPLANRTLPSNGTSLLVLAYLGLNIFVHFFRLPLRWDFFFIFADRAGIVVVVNLPLLYLLAAKNQPLRLLTGYSYEALNIFHRRVGELMCFEAAVHFASMLVWQFVLADEWLLASQTPGAYFSHPIILFGIGALISYELLYFTSLASFRQRWYELFLASHVLLQLAALVFLWLHFYTSRPYVALSLVIFLADRLVWRLVLKRADIEADICILDKDTYLLSADWDIPPPSPPQKYPWWQPSFLRRQSVLHGWHPADHVFLTVPVLGGTHALQTHPFTIASAAPGRPGDSTGSAEDDDDDDDDDDNHHHHHHRESPSSRPRRTPTHAWFSLLIRAHDGFTRDLLRYALAHSPRRVPVRLDGPYGSPHALRMLRASGCAVLVAGGSGIAVAFPLVWALLREFPAAADDDDDDIVCDGKPGIGSVACRGRQSTSRRRMRRRVHLMWVTHSRWHREWVPSAQLDELVARGLDLVIPEPTAEAGRPDVGGMVGGCIEGAAAEGREVGVVVSGPDGLNRTVRNICAEAIGRGRDVRVAVEKFAW